MALTSAQIAVGTAAVIVSSATDSLADKSQSTAVTNTGSTAVFLGPAAVTTSTGYSLPAGATFSVDLGPDEQLFAITAVSGTVHVLRTGV